MTIITADEARKRVTASVESCGPGPLQLAPIVEAVASRLVEAYSEGYRTALLSRRNDYAAMALSGLLSTDIEFRELRDSPKGGRVAMRAKFAVEHVDALLEQLSIERKQ